MPDDLKIEVESDHKQENNTSTLDIAIENGETIDTFEDSVRQTLQRALNLTNGDIPETAKRLKLSRSSFYRMVQKYRLTKPVPKT